MVTKIAKAVDVFFIAMEIKYANGIAATPSRTRRKNTAKVERDSETIFLRGLRFFSPSGRSLKHDQPIV